MIWLNRNLNLTQFVVLLFRKAVVYGKAFYQILFQHMVSQYAESRATLAFNTVTYRNNDIECINHWQFEF